MPPSDSLWHPCFIPPAHNLPLCHSAGFITPCHFPVINCTTPFFPCLQHLPPLHIVAIALQQLH